MNVYVRELSAALAQTGTKVTVYVRRSTEQVPRRVSVEPGLEVVHVDAGPPNIAKDRLPLLVDQFADAVSAEIDASEMDVVHANYWLSAQAGKVLKARFDVPLLATFHTLARVKTAGGDAESEERALIEADLVDSCDAICASNPVESEQLISMYGAHPERVEIIPPGVDHAFFSPGSRAGARQALGFGDEPILLFVGRIQPLKGLDLAVRVLAELDSDVRLLVVGGPSGSEGPAELLRAKRLIADLGLAERVEFVPPVPHHLLSTYYRSADVAIVPSRSESFGFVALEAAACGLPVVAAEVGGLRSLVRDSVTGFLIDSRAPGDFAKRVQQLLDDSELAARMGNAAAVESQRYAWSVTARRLNAVYDEVAARSSVGCC